MEGTNSTRPAFLSSFLACRSLMVSTTTRMSSTPSKERRPVMMTNSQESFTSLSSFLPPAFSFLNFSCTFWISTQEQVSASQAQPGKHWVAEAQPQVQVLSDQVRP